MVKKREKNLKEREGLLVRFYRRLSLPFWRLPLPEVYHDWCTVQGFADRVKLKVISEQEGIAEGPSHEADKRRDRYATVQAYLNLARVERSPGRAWNYVNSADKILPLMVDAGDRPRCLCRLRSWDNKLYELKEDAKDVIDELNLTLESELGIEDEDGGGEDHNREAPSPLPPSDVVSGSVEYESQATRARLWYEVNSRLVLRFSLWSSYNARLLTILIVFIALSEFTYHVFLRPNDPIWFLPFIAVSLSGLFGGVLSTQILTREFIENERSAGLINTLTLTRILIGAAGAVVFVLFAASGYITGLDIFQATGDNVFVLLSTGVVAGFSEQLFIGALDRHTRNLTLVETQTP
ncbi:MAG: hypothetical protein V3V98_03425 [Thermoplasmata archaeon]